jgi:formamidase
MAYSNALIDDPASGHNRWHPDIPPIGRIALGEDLRIETRDGGDGQVRFGDEPDTLAEHDFTRSHAMTGPFFVDGVRAGDVLEVEVVALEPGSTGWTTITKQFGLLSDLHIEPFIAHWTIADGVAASPQIPGVVIPGRPFLGVMGNAPSPERFELFRRREARLAALGFRVPLPDPHSAVPASAADGLRTVPPRETGGNLDVKQLTAGSRLLLPVDIDGALFSAGDMHFAQGDGESSGTAIEIAGSATLRFGVRPGPWKPTTPVIEHMADCDLPGPTITTTGIPIDEDGAPRYHDILIAARYAMREMLDYLETVRGFTRSQALVLLSVAVDLRIGSVVNDPNTVVTASLPLTIFTDG